MTDFRALCADLLAWSETTSSHYYSQPGVIIRARNALAEPEPEGPTDEEIMELMPQQMRDDLAAAARALSGFDPDNIKAASVFRIILNRHAVDHALAVLAKWGNHPESPDSSTQPIPPRLKEQALKELKDWTDEKHGAGGEAFLCQGLSVAIIRQALESLPD